MAHHSDEDDISYDGEEDNEVDEEMQDNGLEDAEVVTKYKVASEIANRVVKAVGDACVAGATTLDLCKLGDSLIEKETSTLYSKKVNGKFVKRGVAFPTCVSVNSIICNHTPTETDPITTLAKGDVVKIDLGVHLAGYAALVASTVIVGGSKEQPVTGRTADVVMACHYAMEAALRTLRPGASTGDVSKVVQQVAAEFGCKPVENMMSYVMHRNIIDGDKGIAYNPSEQQKKDHKESQIEVNEVYNIDIVMSAGEGKVKPSIERTTVYKKTMAQYQLKMRASRSFFHEVGEKFGFLPFSLRACPDEKKARMGLMECTKHGVIQPYEQLADKEGAIVVQCKAQVLLLPSGTLRVTNGTMPTSFVKSEHRIKDEALYKLINSSLSGKSKKKAAAAGAGAGATATAATTAPAATPAAPSS